jgi:hypothetical protein
MLLLRNHQNLRAVDFKSVQDGLMFPEIRVVALKKAK